MPRSKTGVTRPAVNVANLEEAAEDVINNWLGVRTAARKYNVSKSTLDRHVKKFRSGNNNGCFIYTAKNDIKKVFNYTQEVELVEYFKQAARMHYGLTKREALKLAYEYATENNINIPNSWNVTKSAGLMWLRGLRKRHPSLTLRKPEATSLSRATSFNQENVNMFFTKLKEVIMRYKFRPDRIYNADETGNSTVHVPPKVMSAKGVKQVGSVTSGERGVNITMIAAINAIGNHVPPMLIFPRVHFKSHMLIGAPPGSVGGANPSGWSNEKLFVDYLNHFIGFAKSTINDPVLLILDNHESHITIEAINIAKENGVVMLTIPPHTSHKLQPLDRTCFGPYKTYYNVALNEWMVANPGIPVTIYNVAGIIGKAFTKSFNKVNIEKGFRVTGIYPFNENPFEDHEYLSSYVTDRPIGEHAKNHPEDKIPLDKENAANHQNDKLTTVCSDHNIATDHTDDEPVPSTSSSFTSNNISCIRPTSPKEQNIMDGSSHHKSPEIIRPFSKAAPRKTVARGRPKGKTRILTDTPEKREIEAIKLKKTKVANKTSTVKKSVKRKLTVDTSEDEDDISLAESSDDDFSTYIQNLQTDENEMSNMEDMTITNGSFILVRVSGKKTFSYFVAEVMKVLSSGDFKVKYYKRVNDNKFILEKEDLYDINNDDIVKKLPAPIAIGGSERQVSQILFRVDFRAYNMH